MLVEIELKEVKLTEVSKELVSVKKSMQRELSAQRTLRNQIASLQVDYSNLKIDNLDTKKQFNQINKLQSKLTIAVKRNAFKLYIIISIVSTIVVNLTAVGPYSVHALAYLITIFALLRIPKSLNGPYEANYTYSSWDILIRWGIQFCISAFSLLSSYFFPNLVVFSLHLWACRASSIFYAIGHFFLSEKQKNENILGCNQVFLSDVLLL